MLLNHLNNYKKLSLFLGHLCASDSHCDSNNWPTCVIWEKELLLRCNCYVNYSSYNLLSVATNPPSVIQLTIFRAIFIHSQGHFNSMESIESWLITLYKVSWEKSNCSRCVLAWGYQQYVITLPALIGEHSCGGSSCQLIYILECLYSNLCKFFHFPCPSASDGDSLPLKHWLFWMCWNPAVSLVASESFCLPGSSDVCFTSSHV